MSGFIRGLYDHDDRVPVGTLLEPVFRLGEILQSTAGMTSIFPSSMAVRAANVQ